MGDRLGVGDSVGVAVMVGVAVVIVIVGVGVQALVVAVTDVTVIAACRSGDGPQAARPRNSQEASTSKTDPVDR